MQKALAAMAAFLAAPILILSSSVHADTIHLKNGGELKGVIRSETPDQVVLDFGYGTTEVNRSDIKGISRDVRSNSALLRENRERSMEAGDLFPPGGKELARAMKAALRAREKAHDAQRRNEEFHDELIRLESELADIDRKGIPKPGPCTSAINSKVSCDNSSGSPERAQSIAKQNGLRKTRSKIEHDIRAMTVQIKAYPKAYKSLRTLANRKLPKLCRAPADEDTGIFCSCVKRVLAQMSGDAFEDDAARQVKQAQKARRVGKKPFDQTISLQGIISTPEGNKAIINNSMVGEGEWIGTTQFKVVKITQNRVTFFHKGKTFTRRVSR
ncbi:MAG: hypothetical protein NTY77_20035 [Elusimicrobia bacterium]|nr:hypothetical protein [Elusimicrobiota bacterium]